MQVQVDPNELRYTASLFSNGANELREKAKRIEDILYSLVQGKNSWSGEAAQAFSTKMEKLHSELQQKAGILDEAVQILNQFALQMDHVNQLRNQASQLEHALWSISGDSESAMHERQSISYQINQLQQEADWQANAADAQATSAFNSLSIPMPDFNTGEQSPSLLDEIGHALKNTFDFIGGATYAVADDLSMGLLDKVLDDDAEDRSEAYQKGKILGDEISVGIGVVATIDGLMEAAVGATAGIVLSETGVGALAGGAIALGGVAEAAYGIGETGTSLSNLQNDTMSLAKIRNGGLAGQKHPVTGVPFDSEGYPVFDSKFDAQLDPSLYTSSDRVQFKEATKQLYQKIQNDLDFSKKFTKEQLVDIANGDTPKGYTWHHHQDDGKMQLVENNPHKFTGHTGGRATWGGGSSNRK